MSVSSRQGGLDPRGASGLHAVHARYLSHLLKKYPKDFDNDAQLEVSRLMALPTIEFKRQRAAEHILRIAYSHYFLQRELLKLTRIFGHKRHFKVRLFRAKLAFPFGQKEVLGIAAGACLRGKYEVIGETHIVHAVAKFIPGVQLVQRSYYHYKDPHENFSFIYVEIEKSDTTLFTLQEIRLLQKSLSEEFEKRVEKLTPAVFATQNQEEMIKNVLMLSKELRYVKDLPQVMISFEEQSERALIFSVIFARILKGDLEPWDDALTKQTMGPVVRCLESRSQLAGYVRSVYPKEAVMLRLQVLKEKTLLRTDSSINLYAAREQVCRALSKVIGEFRDYNGGVILKRLELLSRLRERFRGDVVDYVDFIEDIFYSLTPMELQATIALSSLETLIELILEEGQEKLSRDRCIFRSKAQAEQIYVAICSEDPNLKKQIDRALIDEDKLSIASIASASAEFEGSHRVGYIYYTDDPSKQRLFVSVCTNIITQWEEAALNRQILKLGVLNLPVYLDPRLGGDEISGNILKMLFEGLTRIGENGAVVPGVAESWTISPDGTEYLFFLRNTLWSDGRMVTAEDFAYAWKKTLSPSFKNGFTYLFFPIKNARLAKEGAVSPHDIGIEVVNSHTLKVKLEFPAPYFLKLIAHTLFFPVNQCIAERYPEWASGGIEHYSSNGPFALGKIVPGHNYELVKNKGYWDTEAVHLEKILIFKSTPYVSIERYRRGEIDWLGRPLSPWESCFDHKGVTATMRLSGVLSWCTYNTKRFPFHCDKVRKALSAAIDRKQIIEELSYPGWPAGTQLPLVHTFHLDAPFRDGDAEYAQQMFSQALKELGISRKEFPSFTLLHVDRDIKSQVALAMQKAWKEVLDIESNVESCEWHTLFPKLVQREYDAAIIGWSATIDHPLYTLEAFKNARDPVNFSQWENFEYIQALEKATKEQHEAKIAFYLAQAEAILIETLPVMPLFYEIEKCVKNPRLQGVYLGHDHGIEVKGAYVTKAQTERVRRSV